MEVILKFLEGINTGPLWAILDLLSFDPARLAASLILLAAVMTANDLIRTALMVQMTRSVATHAIIDTLTLWPGIMLGFLLLYAARVHPDRVWINLGLALGLYVFWILGGVLTKLSRPDTEGTDIGWISHGAIITVGLGLIGVVIRA
ncbi:MAG: hypothetical protein FJW20_22140 [Acidimicrobiia bacterium]|nr:hypothetical protein [Acidimicrobiia bacterium]